MTKATQTIPNGYKQTEIGVIPEDWDVKKLGEFDLDISDGNYSSKYPKASEFKERGIPFIRANNIKNLRVIDNELRFISNKLHSELIKGHLKKDDILITTRGEIGQIAIVPDRHIGSNINAQVVRINAGEKFNKYYFAYFLIKSDTQESLLNMQTGSALKQLPVGKLKELKIIYPSLPEQTAIATALSDTDALIENLEKLIAKKKAIKQGAMQQLLTGKKRLPGFSGEWVRKKIGDIGEITGSGVDKKTSPDELPVRLVNFLNVYHQSFIYSKDLNHLVTARPDQITRCSVKKGDVFFTPSSEMPYDVGLSAVAIENMPDVVYSYHVDRLRLFEDWDILFRAYIFQTKDFSDQTAAQCEGSGKRYVLNLTTFRERLTVYYPTDKNEQIAIATILSDIDAEIEKLENKLGKYRQIKTGMMQQLLTGKIRLLRK